MPRPNVRKKERISEDETNAFTIVFTLIHSEEPMSLSEISKEIELPANLVFYHLKNLKERNIVLETEDKKYTCQPILKCDASEDLDALIFLMIKTIAREIEIEKPTETTLRDAVIENLRMYIKLFEIEIE